MGLEYITQPQVFLAPITALGGLQGATEAYPLLTTYQTWTSTASVPASVWPIPGTWTMLSEPGSFIITVGGVVQNLTEYSIDNSLRRLIFTTPVSANVEIVGRQLATAAPSSASFNFVTAVSGRVTNLSAVNFNSTNSQIANLTATNLLVSNLTALSSILNIVDITQYEISGFNVQGDASITGTVSALNIILTDNGTLLGATSATSIGVGSLSARALTVSGNISASGSIRAINTWPNRQYFILSADGPQFAASTVSVTLSERPLTIQPNLLYTTSIYVILSSVAATQYIIGLSGNAPFSILEGIAYVLTPNTDPGSPYTARDLRELNTGAATVHTLLPAKIYTSAGPNGVVMTPIISAASTTQILVSCVANQITRVKSSSNYSASIIQTV